jgi:L-2,4-diaminobutyric acid acetyltransferase
MIVIAVTISVQMIRPEGRVRLSGLLGSIDMAPSAGSPVTVRPNIGANAGEELSIGRPSLADGVGCWRLAAASGTLDVNSRYAYLLWCRDFAATSVVARRGEDVLGFVTGFRRPEAPSTLVVWQVAVAEEARGRGVAGAMLDAVFDGASDVDHLEATITPDNHGSIALFSRFAERRDAPVQRSELFGAELLGADHEPEYLYRIGPVRR